MTLKPMKHNSILYICRPVLIAAVFRASEISCLLGQMFTLVNSKSFVWVQSIKVPCNKILRCEITSIREYLEDIAMVVDVMLEKSVEQEKINSHLVTIMEKILT